MNEFYVQLVKVTNMSPWFKGGSVTVVGIIALLFAWWMKARWKEPIQGGFIVFVGLAAFITLFGLFILLLQPQWWKLPY
ncbi:MAG: hypothetical protein QME05_03635 [Candidatus Margulisbacteria bacterium]|nr:hypothetical protein [Candidatus Margulisiibacteriota bacterium]